MASGTSGTSTVHRGKPLQRQRHRQQLLWGQLRALGTAGGEVPSATSGGSASAVEDVAWMNGRKMREGIWVGISVLGRWEFN